MIIADSKKLMFVHIYKTGGTSITRLMMPHISEDFRSKYPRTIGADWQSTWHFDAIQHSKLADALPLIEKSNLDLNEYTKFVFVRNPYSWILSIWNNFYQSPQGNLENNLQNSVKFMLRGILNKKLNSQYFYEMYPDGSFKSFVLFIKAVVQKNPPIIEKIWGATDQYSFIENDCGVSFDFIGRFENLQEDVNKIYNMTNAEATAELSHEIRAGNREERQDYLKYYDEESIAIVNELFQRDFEAFGYQPIDVQSNLGSRQINRV
jgi:hypothetical protein